MASFVLMEGHERINEGSEGACLAWGGSHQK